jgi:hypothetical protein
MSGGNTLAAASGDDDNRRVHATSGMPADAHPNPQFDGRNDRLCADMQRFRLCAAVRCAVDDRNTPEQLRRCITRPPLTNEERVECSSAEQLVLKFQTPSPDGTTDLLVSPLKVDHAAGGDAGTASTAALQRPLCVSQYVV